MMQLDWLIEGHLAGSVRPVTSVEPGSDLRWLHERGIRLLVSLAEAPLSSRDCPEDLEMVHFPLADRGVPSPRAVAKLCLTILDAIIDGRPVAVSGSTGFSRTATILASCLVAWRGHADEGIEAVKALGPSYVPTPAQELFVRRFELDLCTPGSLVNALATGDAARRSIEQSDERGGPRSERGEIKTA
jgi:hypothetical protein